MNQPTADPSYYPSLQVLTGDTGPLPGLNHSEASLTDETALPSSRLIEEEISGVIGRELSHELEQWAERYSRVGNRNPYLCYWRV